MHTVVRWEKADLFKKLTLASLWCCGMMNDIQFPKTENKIAMENERKKGRTMQIIHDKESLRKLVEQFGLQAYVTRDLLEIAEIHVYSAGEYIAKEGMRTPYFYFLVRGEIISYSYTCTGKIHCESYMSGFGILGQAAALWDQPAFNDVLALTECVFVCIRTEVYGQQLLEDNKFLRFVNYWLSQHVRENAQRHNPLEVRMAKFILRVEKGGVFRFNLSQCADILETSYRHLLRVLKQMCDSQLLQRNGNGYRILNQRGLEQLSQGEFHLTGTDGGSEKE